MRTTGRSQSNLFSLGLIIVLFVGSFLLIEIMGKQESKKDLLEEKRLMQSADQVKRKGYDIEHRLDAVCGYYYWRDELKWNTDSYCVGQHGTVKTLPDTLNDSHQRMIEEVDKIAERKGYGGW